MLILRFCMDMSEAEIADTLGMDLGAVKSTTARGLATLARELTENTMTDQDDTERATAWLSSIKCRETLLPTRRARSHAGSNSLEVQAACSKYT